MPFKQVALASPVAFNCLQSVAFGGVHMLRVNAELEVILLCPLTQRRTGLIF